MDVSSMIKTDRPSDATAVEPRLSGSGEVADGPFFFDVVFQEIDGTQEKRVTVVGQLDAPIEEPPDLSEIGINLGDKAVDETELKVLSLGSKEVEVPDQFVGKPLNSSSEMPTATAKEVQARIAPKMPDAKDIVPALTGARAEIPHESGETIARGRRFEQKLEKSTDIFVPLQVAKQTTEASSQSLVPQSAVRKPFETQKPIGKILVDRHGEKKPPTEAGAKSNEPMLGLKPIDVSERHTAIPILQTAIVQAANANEVSSIASLNEMDPPALKAELLFGRVSDPKMMTPTALPSDPSIATVRHMAPQISHAVHQSQNGMTEVALSPEELGKVRMTMLTSDNNITLTVFAERPETGDLMRRHIEILTQDLKSLGYNSVDFSFGKRGDAEHGAGNSDAQNDTRTFDGDDKGDVLHIERPQHQSDGLDLRL